MKKWLILVFLLSTIIVFADERITLEIGEEFELEGKNIALVKLDAKHDAAIFCVNGQKGIVSEDGTNSINGVYIELERLTVTSARVDISYDCDDENCECGIECNNDVCFETVEELIDENDEIIVEDVEAGEPLEDVEVTVDGDETIIEPESVGTQGIVIAVLIILVLILGVVVLWKRS